MKLFKAILFCAVFAHSGLALAQGYTKPYIGDFGEYTIAEGDTLVHIAREKGLGFVELRAANPDIDPWLPETGRTLFLPSRHIFPDAPREGIVINLAEMRLFSFVGADENTPPVSYPLGVGREGLETPTGQTKIVRKKDGPSWSPTLRMREADPSLPRTVPPGPENPLGTHALYLGWPEYLIHGTNKPYGIGRRVSSGCIRMYPEHIPLVFESTPVGTPVTVVNQPVKLAWIDDKLYLEAHPDMEQAFQMEDTGQIYEARMSDADLQMILDAAGDDQDKLHWTRIRNAMKYRPGYPVMIARREGAELSEYDKDLPLH